MSISGNQGEAATSRFAILLTLLAAAGLTTIGLCLVFQILGRSVFVAPMTWTGELARFAAVWTALLAAAAAFEMHALHKVDMAVSALPTGMRKLAFLGAGFLVGAMLVFLVYFGVAMTIRVTGQRSSVMGVSMAWVYASVPAAAACMILTLLRKVARGQAL